MTARWGCPTRPCGFNGQINHSGQVWWITPIILATWEAEIRRLKVKDNPDKK
jgi:hypothetical protein